MDAEVLRQMLTERRAAIKPEDLGIVRLDPRGRKSPGLTQAHMDDLLLRAPGTYGRLERGVLDNPTPEYLRDVATLLGLNAQEWVAFYGYARGELPPYPIATYTEISVPGRWTHAVQASAGQTYICDSLWNVLTFNEGFAAMFPGRRVPKNTMRWMLFDEDARNRTLIDWDTRWAPVAVPQVRLALAHHKGSPLLRELTRRALADPRTRDLYTSVPPGHAHPDGAVRPWLHPELGPGTVTMCVSEPASSPGFRMFHMLFLPAGEQRPERAPLQVTGEHDPDDFYPAQGHQPPVLPLTTNPGPNASRSPGAPGAGGSS
ncbi:helix-turn-helix transcriptional regulator [Streptomyces luteireticuli]|uniref:MmyB-like transcription regulator ligand binding domain-containing protein n=1 Tax=Streptomyces luteireticuli TaxID=173858 RepID=A0ABP3I391_9ACTN